VIRVNRFLPNCSFSLFFSFLSYWNSQNRPLWAE